eukprot:TRINITY_DN9793_c0_g1_i1.p1 TRINITY_DN9793_c0_g1~~TRINITY_DN9793_c0_g1_i1.p1  ORF type:complete len:375 (-),score=121.21 TRINITY_DN9793_c0_g1_i1:155-1279(-)
METAIIKIKSPSANIPDLQFTCDLDEKIIQIKKRISESYPTKPAESAQKLVYSGKILKDSDHLCDILRFEDECAAFTFHLVCAIPQKQKTSPTATSSDGLRQRSTGASSSNATSGASLPEPVAQTNINQNNPMMEEMMRTFSTQYSQAMASMPSTPSESEVAAMQQMYNQYLTMYMQYMQSQSASQQSQVLLQQNFPNQNQFNFAEPNAAPAAPVGGEGAPNAAMVMNAGAAGQIQADAGGDRNRDILDWVYVMTRVLLLFSVIYFHSSFLRLAFVAGLGFLVYMYQNRRNGRARARAQNPQPANPEPVEQQQQQDREQADENAEEANIETDDNEENAAEAPVVEEPKPSKFAVVFTFFSTLVSSIIPEQPQVV